MGISKNWKKKILFGEERLGRSAHHLANSYSFSQIPPPSSYWSRGGKIKGVNLVPYRPVWPEYFVPAPETVQKCVCFVPV